MAPGASRVMSEETIGVQRDRLPFTIVENAVFEDQGLSKEARTLYWALCYHADKEGRCFPSLSTLSKETGSGRTTVVSSLKSLCRAGYIVCASRVDAAGDRCSNLYTIKGKRKRGGSTQEDHPQSPPGPRVVPGKHSNHTHLNQMKSAESTPRGVKPKSDQPLLIALFFDLYRGKLGAAPNWTRGKDHALLKGDLARLGAERMREAIELFFGDPPGDVAAWCKRVGWTYAQFHGQMGRLEQALSERKRKLRLLKTCTVCGKTSETTGIDCPKCGAPDAYQKEVNVAAK